MGKKPGVIAHVIKNKITGEYAKFDREGFWTCETPYIYPVSFTLESIREYLEALEPKLLASFDESKENYEVIRVEITENKI